jgi:hypothetical protein
LFSAESIDLGRKSLVTDGREHEGRLFYEEGISIALNTFQKAQTSAEPQTIIVTESTFLEQELQYCNDADTYAKGSLTQAIQSFEDAIRCFETVHNADGYKYVEKSYPTASKYRVQGYPKDAVHLACIAHQTRLRNVLRSPGINMIEKAVLQQRAANMTVAQGSYLAKQKAALGSS